jgi:hypothetical protein
MMTPGTPDPVNSSPTWKPPMLMPPPLSSRTVASLGSSVRPRMFEKGACVPSAATVSKLKGWPPQL